MSLSLTDRKAVKNIFVGQVVLKCTCDPLA